MTRTERRPSRQAPSPADGGRGHAGDRWLTVANLVVGAWLLASPVVFAGSLLDGRDDATFGLVLVGLACYGGYRVARERPLPAAVPLVSVGVGMWLFAFSLQYGRGAPLMYDSALAGVLLVLVSVALHRRYYRRV